MAQNTARWEEGTEITLDATVETPATGWTLGHTNVIRIGSLVAVHIEATFTAGAAALVTTLQGEFRPTETVTVPVGASSFTIGADGKVSYSGSTAGGGTVVCDGVYQAASVSP
jgi:hypothetical protein